MEDTDRKSRIPLLWEPVMALAMPFVVWPIELWLPYPYIVEELAKALLVYRGAVWGRGIGYGALIGLIFGLSETMLYLVNAIGLGKIGILGPRMILTMPMHALTGVLIYTGMRKGIVGGVAGLAAAMVVHWGFNALASSQ